MTCKLLHDGIVRCGVLITPSPYNHVRILLNEKISTSILKLGLMQSMLLMIAFNSKMCLNFWCFIRHVVLFGSAIVVLRILKRIIGILGQFY